MKTSERITTAIFIFIWNLPILGFDVLILSSELCGLNNWAAWFIAIALFSNRCYTDLKHDSLEEEIKKLKK